MTQVARALPTLSRLTSAVVLAVVVWHFGDLDAPAESGIFTSISVVLLLLCALFAAVLALSASRAAESAFWLATNMGFIFLAADERYQIHEGLDLSLHAILRLQETQLTDQIDGFIVFGYAAVAGLIGWRCRAILVANERAGRALLAGFLFTAITIALDLSHSGLPFDNGYFEESAKLIAECAFLCSLAQSLAARSTGSPDGL